MIKTYKILFLLIIYNFCFSQYTEFNFGYNRSNGEFEKYTDDGFSIRASYSNNIKNSDYFRWQGSFQYISFYRDKWQDSIALQSGNDGPSIDVTNSENGYTIQGGIRFTPERGFFQQSSIFKPYASFNIGAIYLQEKTIYSDPDDLWDGWGDNGNDYFTLDDIEDYRFNFIYSVELGTNFNFKNTDGFGLDLGIRYNMCPKIRLTEDIDWEIDSDGNAIRFDLKDKLNAAYYTVYIGVTMDLHILSKKNSAREI